MGAQLLAPWGSFAPHRDTATQRPQPHRLIAPTLTAPLQEGFVEPGVNDVPVIPIMPSYTSAFEAMMESKYCCSDDASGLTAHAFCTASSSPAGRFNRRNSRSRGKL